MEEIGGKKGGNIRKRKNKSEDGGEEKIDKDIGTNFVQSFHENKEEIDENEDSESEPDDTMLQIQMGDDAQELEKQQIYYRASKKMGLSIWHPTLSLVEVVQIRGNFWRKNGFSENGKNYLYPEDALYLLERRQITISRTLDEMNSEIFMSKEEVYDLFFDGIIDLAAYLVYAKLRSLDYIPVRRNKTIRVFRDDRDIQCVLSRNPLKSLLDVTISYHIYCDGENVSKSSFKDKPPVALLLMTNGRDMFSNSIMTQLIQQVHDIPLMIGIVFPTGNVLLEEFTNAELTLRLDNFPLPKDVNKKKGKKKEQEGEK